MPRVIEMTIPLKGLSKGERKVIVEANGFKGEGCKAATEIFTKSLGGVSEETLKGEYYETEERQEFLREG